MTIFIIALVVAIGFVFLVIEVFLIPGFSVPGLVGLAMIGYGIYKAKSEYGMNGVLLTLAVSAVAAVILIRVTLKSRAAGSMQLAYSQKDTSAIDDYSALVGMKGKALSILRPSGIALINNTRYDVVTDGEFINAGSPIQVTAVDGTRIVVSTAEGG